MNKELIITFLIILLIYLAYQKQNNKEIPQEVRAEINQLQEQVNHFQTLYQSRVEKDIGDSEKVVELTEQLTILEEIINQPQNNAETQTELSAEDITNLTIKAKYYQTLSEQKAKTLALTQQGLKTTQENSEELETLLAEKEQETNENLRKINLLFDNQAQNYKLIDFNGLYSLLQKIAEKERAN